jgi:hypothetical protein
MSNYKIIGIAVLALVLLAVVTLVRHTGHAPQLHHQKTTQHDSLLETGEASVARETNVAQSSAGAVAASSPTLYIAFSNLWLIASLRELHKLNVHYRSVRVAYTSAFSEVAARFYYSIFCDDENGYVTYSNGVWQGVQLGVRIPTDNVDFIRFALEVSALNKKRSDCATIVARNATNQIYRAVLEEGYRKFFVHRDDYHCGTNDTTRMACVAALISPPTFDNITNFNVLYADVMQGRRPEYFHSYLPLNPDAYPVQAREWALFSTNQQLRESQQSEWKRATNSLAPDVLEEILRSWSTQPPAHWKTEPRWKSFDRRQMKEIIKEKRARLRSAPE